MARELPAEERCAHETCNCDISTSSPSAYCCELCDEERDRPGRCRCGHPACGGVPDADIDKNVALRRGTPTT